MDTKRAMLRHCLATLAYRGGKVLRNAPADFADYRASETTRTPAEILAHLGDLLDWGLSMAHGKTAWKNTEITEWQPGVDRFLASIAAFDNYLASGEPLGEPAENFSRVRLQIRLPTWAN